MSVAVAMMLPRPIGAPDGAAQITAVRMERGSFVSKPPYPIPGVEKVWLGGRSETKTFDLTVFGTGARVGRRVTS